MRPIPRLLMGVAFAATIPLSALAAHTHVPTPSTWTLNLTESDFGGGPPMKSDKMTILVDTDKWFKFTDVMTDSDGKTLKSSWSGPQDGTPRPVVGMPGTTASFNTADDSSRWVMPDGSISDSTLSLSDDKKKATLKMNYKTRDGKEFNQTLVYDRVK